MFWPLRRASSGVRSEWAMPRPAVIRFIAPGMISMRIALAVAMHDLAVEQIGHGGEPDMGMRPHVHPLPGDELHRAEMVEEDERPDHLALAVRQRAAHRRSRRRDRGCAAR